MRSIFYISKFRFLTFYFLKIAILLSPFNSLSKNIEVSPKQKEVDNNLYLTKVKWEKYYEEAKDSEIFWEKHIENDFEDLNNKIDNSTKDYTKNNSLSVLNRSIVFNNNRVGPDISWLVPPGLIWNNKFLFDSSVRGHNRRKNNENFFGWNGGDAVGQFYYHFLQKEKYGFGINFGMRSIYKGSMPGGTTSVGEGLSSGFRFDYKLSNNSGFSLGGEQLLHFDGLTDTGRDFYITTSKGFWKYKKFGTFPLDVYTFGFGTGKLSEGHIKGLCSDLFGGGGIDVSEQRSLCWAPVFTIARVHNYKLSTFFEYNSKWFLIGTSYVPFKNIPARGTFALQISDHIDNYKINNFNEMKWVFRLSLGF